MADEMSHGPGSATDMQDPVIVTGAPRTGVRLLAAIMDGHPSLASGPDLPVVTTLVQQWHEIRTNLGSNHERHHGVPPEASRAAFRDTALRLFAPRLQLTGKQRFVLQGFSAAMLLDKFAALLPGARFVLMVRDPRNVVRSLLGCDWRDTRTGEALPYTRDPAAAARFSVEFMNSALQNAAPLRAAGRLMALHYERLCAEPQRAMSEVGKFLDESAPPPFVLPDSAALVTESQDNPHPPLRVGEVDLASCGTRGTTRAKLALAEMQAATDRLCSALGYRPL
jgi:hypothetical protein